MLSDVVCILDVKVKTSACIIAFLINSAPFGKKMDIFCCRVWEANSDATLL